jgi:hypothetical protein
MDVRLLIKETESIGLTLLSPCLYDVRYNYLVYDDNYFIFHDEEKSDLFFIHLNEFLNVEFSSPLSKNKKVSLFQLLIDFSTPLSYNSSFKEFLDTAIVTKEFFFKKRYYKYYISPHDIDFEISFAELINFQANYSKHSFYHLENLKNKLKKIFKINMIESYESEDYNDHLDYFKEAVLDDRLQYNQTHFVVILGDFFLSFWDLINSPDNRRIRDLISDFIRKNGRYVNWNIEKPKDFNEIENFHWEIRGINFFEKSRFVENIPKKYRDFPIEKETSKTDMLLFNE